MSTLTGLLQTPIPE